MALSDAPRPQDRSRRSSGLRGRRGRHGVPPVASADELQTVVSTLPQHSEVLELTVEFADLIRVLTVVDPDVTVDRLVLTVADWERPHRRWNGSLGRVMHVLSYSLRFPDSASRGAAQVDIALSKRASLADVARAVYPLFGVDRGLQGYGFVQLGTAAATPAALALLPSRTAPGLPGIPTRHLQGVGLSRADVGLVGTPEAFEEYVATADDPELTMIREPLLVDPSGHLAVSERHELPIVDLNVHNPIGRVQDYVAPAGSLAATVADGRLMLRPVGKVTGDLSASSRPTAPVLSGGEVDRLRHVEAIDLSGLRARDRDDELLLYRRLAELAATGVVLHSLPASFSLAAEILGKSLADLTRQPYRPSQGLARALRSAPQRREAMQRFGGFFELADHARTMGHRLLPTVSVVLSTMRPARVASVLHALAAQRYPHLEIAVALHGVETPTTPEFTEAVRVSGATVTTYDQSVSFGSVLADTARRTSGDLVVKIDDDDIYGPQVIGDLVLAYLYSNADVVGKTTEYLYFEEIDHTVHRKFMTEAYHYQVAGGAMMLSRAALNEIGGWRPTPNSTDRSVLIRLGNSGAIAYRTHSLGYVYIRHAEGHTWKRGDSLLLRGSFEQWPRFMREIVEA